MIVFCLQWNHLRPQQGRRRTKQQGRGLYRITTLRTQHLLIGRYPQQGMVSTISTSLINAILNIKTKHKIRVFIFKVNLRSNDFSNNNSHRFETHL